MEPSGEYRITRHKGRGPDSKNAKVFCSHLDEASAMRTYRKSVPRKPKGGTFLGRLPSLHRTIYPR
jgi:hypothetical protein